MKLWFAPQISEHCPKKSPGRLEKTILWFSRPGTASILIPKEGIVQAWITSADVIKSRVFILKGSIIRLSTSNRRKLLIFISDIGIIKESKFKLNSGYSYDQYHWCPTILTVKEGLKDSSIKYKIRKDGRAMNISIKAGKIVQIISISCPSRISWLESLFNIMLVIIYKIKIVIIIKIIIEWSWKNISCSIVGEFLSVILILDQKGISYLINILDWLNVCSEGGKFICHSIEELT